MTKKPSSSPWTWIAGALALVAVVAAAFYFARRAEKPVSELANTAGSRTPAAPAATAAPERKIEHPIDEADAGDETAAAAPLPALEDSDAGAIDALSGLVGDGSLAGLVDAKHLIPRIVATIDSLPRRKLAANAMPVRGPEGAFATSSDADRRVIDARNYARYVRYATIAQSIDTKRLVAWYVKNYPLFQQAYRELGYPDGYFNDRLIAAIDDLLATPDATPPIVLAQPNVLYEYADPKLEQLSAGQKLLIRSGPDNAAIVKAKLRDIRAALTGQSLPRDGDAGEPGGD